MWGARRVSCEWRWVSSEPHEQPKPTTNATAKPNESRGNRTASGSRPESKKHIDRHWNITTPNTHTPTHIQRRRRRPGGPGEHWDIAASCTKRIRGAKPRHSRKQRGGERLGGQGMAVATCWEQYWHNRTLLDLLRGSPQPRSLQCEMSSPLSHVARRMSR